MAKDIDTTKIKRDRSGRFKKGTGGKPKGAINKERRAAAEAIKAIVEDRADRLLEIVDKLEDTKFLETWLYLIEFVEPKLSRVDSNNTGQQTLVIKREDANE